MRTALACVVLFLTVLLQGAGAQDQTAQAYTYSSLTVTSSAGALPSALITPTGQQAASSCAFTVNDGAIRFRFDGGTAGANDHLAPAASSFTLRGAGNLAMLSMIRDGSEDATVSVTCARGPLDPLPLQFIAGTEIGDITTGDLMVTVEAQPADDPHFVRCSDGTVAAPCVVSATNLDVQSGGADLATAAAQATGNTSLGNIDTKTPALVSGRVPVDGSAVTQPVSGTVTANLSATDNAVLDDIADGIPVTNAGTFAVQAAQSGTWNVTNISGTVSLPTGAATAANQSTVIGHVDGVEGILTTIDADTGNIVTAVQLIDNAIGSVTGGSAGTGSLLGAGIYRATPPTLTDGQQASLQFDENGNLRTTISGSIMADLEVGAQPANDPHFVQCSDGSMAAPCEVTGTITANLSATDNAVLDDIADGIAVTGPLTDVQLRATPVPVSGTVTANLGTLNGAAADTSVDGLEGGIGASADAAATAGSTGSINAKLRLVTSQLDTLQSTQTAMGTAVGRCDGASESFTAAAASTNATSVKGSAGQICGIELTNTTSTLYYLRIYNTSSAPTCSSATGFRRSVPIPHGTGAGGGIVTMTPFGVTYGTGIGFCITGGAGSTDNTNAATGVFVTVFYK